MTKDFSFEPDFLSEGATDEPGELYRQGRIYEEKSNALTSIGDTIRAMEYYRRAADQGHVPAHWRLGCVHLFRSGRPWHCSEYAAAEKCFEKAGALGNPNALSCLSLMHEYGLGMEADSAEAARLQEEACRLGGDAMNTFRKEFEDWLGSRGLLGLGLKKRFSRFFASLDTPAKRASLVAFAIGLTLCILGLWEFAASRRLSGIEDFLDVNRRHCRHVLFGTILAGAGVVGMRGRLNRLWDWILHGAEKR